MKPALSLITHIYNQPLGLAEQVAHWQSLDAALRAQIEFIVIDDHSDPPLACSREGLNLRLFRVDDDIDWNMPGCRNLGAMLAGAPWLLYFDIDNVLPTAQLAMLLQGLPTLNPRTLHVFRRRRGEEELEPHINSFLISRQGFFLAGGYDEDFAGHYGYEDVLFRNQWRQHVGSETLLTNIAFEQTGRITQGLNRDTTRNDALIRYKAAIGMPKARSLLRFGWHEVVEAADAANPV
jgi:hypothetical protein